MAKLDPNVIRVGDTVEIVTPMFVKRVGYPKCIDDYRDQALADFKEVLQAKLKCKAITRDHDIIKAIARQMLISDGYGGRERSVHMVERPDLVGKTARVQSIRTAYSGTYCPASGGYTYYGEYDYEPPSLTVDKAHRLVRLSGWELKLNGQDVEIPTYNVKKVSNDLASTGFVPSQALCR